MNLFNPELSVMENYNSGLIFDNDIVFITELCDKLINDMNNNRLVIILVPAKNKKHSSHFVRYVESINPDWYSSLWDEYKYLRKSRVKIEKIHGYKLNHYDSYIKRRNVLAGLNKIMTLSDKSKPLNKIFDNTTILRSMIKDMFILAQEENKLYDELAMYEGVF